MDISPAAPSARQLEMKRRHAPDEAAIRAFVELFLGVWDDEQELIEQEAA